MMSFRHWEERPPDHPDHGGKPYWSHPGHHWTNGVFFLRLDDGYVQICQHDHEGAAAELLWAFAIPGAEWASIVASVTKDGEPANFWMVKGLHDGTLTLKQPTQAGVAEMEGVPAAQGIVPRPVEAPMPLIVPPS